MKKTTVSKPTTARKPVAPPATPKQPEVKEAKGTIQFYKDTKRYHAFNINGDNGITGILYMPRDKNVATKITLTYIKKS